MKGYPAKAAFAAAVVAFSAASWTPARAALPDPVRFGTALEIGDLRAAQRWLDEGLDPNFMADRVGTGLMIGAWEGNVPMMALFHSRGADINKTNALQEQALMHAAWRGKLDAVRWLLDHGAEINRPGQQMSALHYAVFAGHDRIARLLIERGANVNARSANGSSVLMLAVREGREALTKMLLDGGADAAAVNDLGEDALTWAVRHQRTNIARMVATPARIAKTAREITASPVRSLAAPEKVEALLRQIRAAELKGNATLDLRRQYQAALAALEKAEDPGTRSKLPKALEITAKRGDSGEEKATLIFEPGQEEPLAKPAKIP